MVETYSAKAVANAFLQLAKSEGDFLTPMKMQKLVYLAHGWALGLTGQSLVSDEIQAWQYGPVIEPLYHGFKRYGSGSISHEATTFDVDEDSFDVIKVVPKVDSDDETANALIKSVWDAYKHLSGGQLSNITHEKGTPWDQTYEEGARALVIDNETIKKHYEDLARTRS